MEFYIRLTVASNRCGNDNTMDAQMKMFIEGLHSTHRTIVSQYHQEDPRVLFLRLVDYAKAQSFYIYARYRNPKKFTLQEPMKSSRTKALTRNWRWRGSTNRIDSVSETVSHAAYLVVSDAHAETFVLGKSITFSQKYSITTYDPSGTFLQASFERTR